MNPLDDLTIPPVPRLGADHMRAAVEALERALGCRSLARVNAATMKEITTAALHMRAAEVEAWRTRPTIMSLPPKYPSFWARVLRWLKA